MVNTWLNCAIVAAVLSLTFGAQGVDRGKPVNYVFTTQVVKVNRTTGQMILAYSPAGKAGMRADQMLQLENYDYLEKKLSAKIKKIHESKPLIIVDVVSGEYKDIEKGFRYKTQFVSLPETIPSDKDAKN